MFFGDKTLIFFSAMNLSTAWAGTTKIPDFYTYSEAEFPGLPRSLTNDGDCRANIKAVMCLQDKMESPDHPGENCLDGGEAYAHYFEELYDHQPPALQKMYCSLRRIFVLKEFYGTAFAGLLKDEAGNTKGAMMGIRESVLTQKLKLNAWASWKEQLSYGGHADSYELTPGLPTIKTNTPADAPVNDFLYFVITHEFGHIFDFANSINATEEPCGENDACKFKLGAWGTLSWADSKNPLPGNNFPDREGLCFYWCDGKPLAKEKIVGVYENLLTKSNFLSIYATTQAWDDFADSLGYYLSEKFVFTSYQLDTAQGKTYSVFEQLHSARFAAKLNYLENFLARDDIIYP